MLDQCPPRKQTLGVFSTVLQGRVAARVDRMSEEFLLRQRPKQMATTTKRFEPASRCPSSRDKSNSFLGSTNMQPPGSPGLFFILRPLCKIHLWGAVINFAWYQRGVKIDPGEWTVRATSLLQCL